MKKSITDNIYTKAFLLGFITAFALFIPFLVADKGFFIYAGDYNSQQIPFYMYMNQMVKSGNFSWSWATDLGSPVITSYSFYLLGSPFFWLSCLFPYKAVPYIMPWLLMLKFAVGNMGAFGYLRRYAKNDNYAMLGAVLYTFSGFSLYNIFFNHFIEAVVFFPYLLWALDEFMYNGRKAVFPIAVAINLLNNYFFFRGQIVFLAIYFSVKVYNGEYQLTVKKFLNIAFESITGCLMGIVLFVPSAISVVENPRVAKSLSSFGLWIYSTVQQYLAIAASALLPPDPPYIPSLFTEGAIKWTSMSAFIVLGGLFGLFVFQKYNRRSSFYKTAVTCIICAFVPVLNSMFYAFNSSYYARWYYMPLLMLAAMNMQSFAMDEKRIFHGVKCTALLTACLLPFGLTPIKNEADGSIFIGLAGQAAVYWLNILIAFLSLYLVYFIVLNYRNSRRYTRYLMCGALYIAMLYGVVHMGITKMPQWENDRLYRQNNYDVLACADFSFGDEDTGWRMDSYECHDNIGLFINRPNIQFFNSTVSPSIMEFYPSVGVTRDVSSKPGHSLYALRSLLSVKYIIMPAEKEQSYLEQLRTDSYSRHSQTGPYTVYVNNSFIPMGFTYDKYETYEQLENVSDANRTNVLLRAIATDEETVAKYSLPLEKLLDDEMYNYTVAAFNNDVNSRRAAACHRFVQTDTGFECSITLDKNNLVFFSVPYEKGFTAYVNGKETEIIKVNYGLCAVYAPAGDNEIVFTWHTPGLAAGIALTAAGWTMYAGYLIYNRKHRNKEIL